MARQVYPYAQLGRPVQKITAKWTIVDRGRMTKFNVGLVERIRTGGAITGVETSYAVVRSKKPIVAHGVKLRALEAVPYKESGFRKHDPLKARLPEVWHSSRPDAEAKFDHLTGRLRPKPTSTTAPVAAAPAPMEAPATSEGPSSDVVQHGPVDDNTCMISQPDRRATSVRRRTWFSMVWESWLTRT